MKTAELKNLSKEELLQRGKSLREELFKLNQQRYTGQVDKPHRFKLVRREIAVIETLLNQQAQKDR
jgi:large subunit ribosomal protein L29